MFVVGLGQLLDMSSDIFFCEIGIQFPISISIRQNGYI